MVSCQCLSMSESEVVKLTNLQNLTRFIRRNRAFRSQNLQNDKFSNFNYSHNQLNPIYSQKRKLFSFHLNLPSCINKPSLWIIN